MIKINFINFKGLNELKVTDDNGKEIISFEKARALPTHACYSNFNDSHEKIGKIEKSRYNFGLVDLPEIVIYVNNDKIKVRRDMKELKEFYEITESEFSISGIWDGPQFDISKNEKVLASVYVEKKELSGTYLVNIIDKTNKEQVLCILFALSWIR